MVSKIVWIGLAATLAFAPLAAPAQTSSSAESGAATTVSIPNRATVRSGTHRTRERHRSTLNRQKARATAEHARQIRSAPNR
jgi:hypothetical protein